MSLVSPAPIHTPFYTDTSVLPYRGHHHERRMSRADGSTKKRSRSPQPTASPTAPAQFTFINQHSDIRSIRDRRITNNDHRHEIRSHVMRNVRLTEHNQGYKRPTGRAPARTKSRDRRTSTTASSTTSPDDGGSEIDVKSESPTTSVEDLAYSIMIQTASRHRSPMLPSPGRYMSSFGQVPGNSLSQAATEALLIYCFKTFLPMTFPVENKKPDEQMARRSIVVQANLSKPATFSGFLATVACHRAVQFGNYKDLSPNTHKPDAGRHSDRITDPDYRRAHGDALQSTQAKIDKGELTPDLLEACFGMISTTTIVGDFVEARTHLNGVKKIIHRIEISQEAHAWLPVADVKLALGLLEEPSVTLPWPKTIIEGEGWQRMVPPRDDPLSNMTSGFANVPGLSGPLRSLVQDAAIICHMCDFNARDGVGLSEQEHVAFRCKSLELEYDLLKYVFDTFPPSKTSSTPMIPPIEDVIRLALLGLLSTISVHVLPGCGLGRAITSHQIKATERWFTSETGSDGMGGQQDLPTLKAMTWAMFMFARCAAGQNEAMDFRLWLLDLIKRVGLLEWEEVEATVVRFLYVPQVLGPGWRGVWQDVDDWRRREGATPTKIETIGGSWDGKGMKVES